MTRISLPGWIRFAAVGVAFSAVVIVLMLWLAGRFSRKIPARPAAGQRPLVAGPATVPAGATTVAVQAIRRPVFESAVGSIRAVHETAISSRIVARVLEVNLSAGKRVAKDEVLARLDDSDLKARLQQANATVESAEATLARTRADEERYGKLLKTEMATQAEYDRALAGLRNAEAELRRAQEAVKESQSMLDYATIKAPFAGIIVDKKVQPGDIVLPGTPMANLYDPQHMQLVASVRESLAYRLKVGQQIDVKLDVLEKVCSGRISEIVPEAQSASRTFQVKVTGPCPANIYSGMFGRVLIPLDEETITVVPTPAVKKVGQLELVEVVEPDGLMRRAVRTGRIIDGQCEILSGLSPGEQVVVPQAAGKEGA